MRLINLGDLLEVILRHRSICANWKDVTFMAIL